jgi:hypothetical protein
MMTVEPRRGMTAYQPREGAPVFLSDMIMELGLAEKEHVEAAVETARSSGETVGRILIREGRLNEDQMARAIAARYGLNHIDLAQFDVDAGAANLLPPAAAQRYRAVPVDFEADGGLLVAMADPLGLARAQRHRLHDEARGARRGCGRGPDQGSRHAPATAAEREAQLGLPHPGAGSSP